jgi:SAM-dependent methyltransferase
VAEQHAAFVGTIPVNYDRYLGPLLFVPYADDLAARLPVAPGTRVLEVACGTGIVTERLVRRLAGQGTLVATDLNDAMIAHARSRIPADPALAAPVLAARAYIGARVPTTTFVVVFSPPDSRFSEYFRFVRTVTLLKYHRNQWKC